MAAFGKRTITAEWLASLLAVAGGCSWAASSVVAKIIYDRHPADLLSLTTWQMLFGSIPLGLIALTELGQPIVWSAEFAWALAFNVLLANALALVLWLWVLRALPAGIAGLGTLAVPVVGVISASIQLSERPSAAEAVGMALIVGALALLSALALRSRPTRSV
jgi:drug/metabolite transporter (DMT)-like permease